MDIDVRSFEASGESVEDAIATGLAELGTTRDQVEIEVVREGSRGVLGIGARDAIVRLTWRQETGTDSEPEPEPEPEQLVETDVESSEESADKDKETLQLARDILDELLEKMQVEATISPRIVEPRYKGDGATLILDLQGKDLGFLIGRKGETLAALQHVVRLMINKALQRRAHIVIDVEGYKARRENALKKLALRMADQATRRGRQVSLEPMSAYERRIIHVALRNHPTVVTESVGERDRRKVTIRPKN